MPTVTVSRATCNLLKRQADAKQRQPDKLANELANTVRWLQEFRQLPTATSFSVQSP